MKVNGFLLSVLLFSFLVCSGQDRKEPLMIDASTIIKNEAGEIIDIFKFQELIKSNEWKVDGIRDDNGTLQYVQLRKATEAEKEEMVSKKSYKSVSSLLGKEVPKLEFIYTNGTAITSDFLNEKVIVLNFWFAACKPCIDELPDLNAVYNKYKTNKDVVFAAITFDTIEKVNFFLKKYSFQYPIVSDASSICKDLGVTGYPTNIVIDKNGIIVEVIEGGIPGIEQKISYAIDNAL